jgi:hypothetical protein
VELEREGRAQRRNREMEIEQKMKDNKKATAQIGEVQEETGDRG